MNRKKRLAHDLIEVSSLLGKRADELRRSNQPLTPQSSLSVPGLLGMPTNLADEEQTLDEEAGSITPTIQGHRGFRWLQKQEGIQEARQSLLKQLQAKKLANWQLGIHEVQFYDYVARYGAFVFGFPEWSPTTFSADDKRQAVKDARNLKDLVEKGVWQPGYERSSMLEELLAVLIADLETPARRDYGGPAARERYILTHLSRCFLTFELDSTARIARLVASVADAYGFSKSQKSYERYVEKARTL
jgi:hypothetical protein